MKFFYWKKAFYIGSLIFLSSCCISMPRDQQLENLYTQPSLECSVNQGLESSYFTLGDWPDEEWWGMFDSPQLNCLIVKALEFNPSIKEVEARIEKARAEAVIARSALFPLVFFNAADSWSYFSKNGLYRALNPTIPLNASLIDLSLSFTYEFDFWGKYHHLFYAALGEEAVKAAEASQVQLMITTAVAQSYFALKTNLVRKQLYTRLYELRSKLFRLQDLLKKNSLLSRLPLLTSEESVLEAEKFVASIDEEIAVDQHLLNILVGEGPDACLEVDTYLPALPEKVVIPETLSICLLARRPDLMAHIWRADALAHEVGAAIADFFPNINLAGLIGLESVFYSKIFQAQSETTNLTPALSLPIFTAGAIRANVQAKKAAFDEAVFAYNALILKSAQEVADLLAFAQSIYTQKQEQDSIVKRAEEFSHLTMLRRKSGLDNLLEQYRAEEIVIEKELENVTLLYSQYLAVIKLIKALGGGFYTDCIPLQAECCR